MIQFTMKILNFRGGTYTVEYIPEHPSCKPIKLSLQIEPEILQDKNKILERLKNSSPQEYWNSQVFAETSSDIGDIALGLINTSYKVKELPKNSTSSNTANQTVNLPQSTIESMTQNGGSSSPEHLASPEDQHIVKLKILIQQVLQEMAEGTV